MNVVILAAVIVAVAIVMVVVGVLVARRRRTRSTADAGRAALQQLAKKKHKTRRNPSNGSPNDMKMASDMYLGSDASGMP